MGKQVLNPNEADPGAGAAHNAPTTKEPETKKTKPSLFFIDEYLKAEEEKIERAKKQTTVASPRTVSQFQLFLELCQAVKLYFNEEWEREQGGSSDKSELLLERQKRAIIGNETEVAYFKDKIQDFLAEHKKSGEWYPEWYTSIVDAIFHENWGLAGISEWKRLSNSSSAKIIGDRIYFLIDGQQKLQPQTISKDRFEQLRKALLLRTPEKRSNDPYSEIYMLSGERISIYRGSLTKEGQPVMVFRKSIVEKYSFEAQANRGTIPADSLNFFKSFAKIGFNVNFVGPVRSAKTTFLTTWQSYEDQKLEGVLVETDPEIPLHEIMPSAPIMQILADNEELAKITKSLMRSDADYLVMAEARDGLALNLAVEMANRGTKRCKSTTHLTMIEDFCFDVSSKIIGTVGGDLSYTMVKVAKSFNYLFELAQLSNKGQKRLKGITEIRYDAKSNQISFHKICKYNYETDSWTFKYDIGEDKRQIAIEENYKEFEVFERELKALSEKYPMKEDNVYIPYYNNIREQESVSYANAR